MTLLDTFNAEAARPLVVCDIDGVLAFDKETAAGAVRARWGLSIDASKLRVYRMEDTLPREQAAWLVRQYQDPGFYVNMAPDFHALDALAQLRDDGLHVTISSDRPAAAATVTRDWLDLWGASYDATWLAGPGSKAQALAQCGPDRPGVLLDDDPAKWLTVARDGVQVLSPQRPWTPPAWQQYPHVQVFQSWVDVVNELTERASQPPIPRFPRDPELVERRVWRER